MTPDFPQWPKPSPIPWCSLILLMANSVAVYLIISFQISYWWVVPSAVLNVLFFWAERGIYLREKRNFEGWCEEMSHLLGETKKMRWSERMAEIKRQRRIRRETTESSEPRTV